MSNELDNQNKGELLIYLTEDGKTKIDVFFEEDTIWLNQKQIAQLYQKGVNTINEHIKHVRISKNYLLEKLICILLILVFTTSCASKNNEQDKTTLEKQIASSNPNSESLLTPINLPTAEKNLAPTSAPTNVNTPDPRKRIADPDGDGFVNFAMEIDGEKKFFKVPVDEALNDRETVMRKIKDGKISESDDSIAQTLKRLENKQNVSSKEPAKLLYEQIKNKVANGESLSDLEKDAYFSYLSEERKDIFATMDIGVKGLEEYSVYEWIKAHVLSYYCNESYFEIIKMRDSNSTWAEIAKSLGINYDIIPSEYKKSPYEE